MIHETAGAYLGAIGWLCDPDSQASAHFVLREDGGQATQLVALHEKAWTQGAYNSRAISIELATTSQRGFASVHQLDVAARMAGWLLRQYRLPPRWARKGIGRGLCFHGELGEAGGGHPQCGPNRWGWDHFLERVAFELDRGGYPREWARR